MRQNSSYQTFSFIRVILHVNTYVTIVVHPNACHVSMNEILKFQQSIHCDIQLASSILRSMVDASEPPSSVILKCLEHDINAEKVSCSIGLSNNFKI